MSRRKYFILGVLLMIILGALDLFITWILTPDLKNEANPFVSEYGFGWMEVSLVSVAFILFVTIPFYYYCLVFNYPDSDRKNHFSFKYISRILFRNHKNLFISLGKFLFYFLGFYLFWRYIIVKITAIVHNVLILFAIQYFRFPENQEVQKGMADHTSGTWSYNIVKYYWENPSRRFDLMEQVTNVFLFIMLLLFFGSIIYKVNRNIRGKQNTNSIHISWVIGFVVLYLSFKVFTAIPGNPAHNYSVKLTDKIDPDIVLINFGEGNRASIANLLLTIDSCNPTLIAIDAFFINEKDQAQDSILSTALNTVQNDIIAYGLDSVGKPFKSQNKFRSSISEEGLLSNELVNGLLSNVTPIRIIDNEIHELFALKIIKHWKPNFKHSLKINKSIPIKFTRTLEQFMNFDSSGLKTNNICEYLNSKVVLLGYLGPSNEDKHFTPIRLVKKYNDYQPDTYGLVIVANEIRTILEFEKLK